jgi:hypothetical protein
MPRIITTEELARFESCRLAWWYDRTYPLAKASATEISKRIDIFEAVYGTDASNLPEYQLLQNQAGALASKIDAPASKDQASAAPKHHPIHLMGCIILVALLIILLAVGSIFFTLANL